MCLISLKILRFFSLKSLCQIATHCTCAKPIQRISCNNWRSYCCPCRLLSRLRVCYYSLPCTLSRLSVIQFSEEFFNEITANTRCRPVYRVLVFKTVIKEFNLFLFFFRIIVIRQFPCPFNISCIRKCSPFSTSSRTLHFSDSVGDEEPLNTVFFIIFL